MDSTTLAIAVKKAREEAERVAAKTAERVARSIVPEKGDDGYTPVKGVDYFDGAPGYTPVKGVDYFDGKDAKAPVKGVDYDDGEPGRDANRWHLFYNKEYPGLRGFPPDEMGDDDDFAINGDDSRIYHKEGGEWVFIMSLQGGGGMQMMAPAVVSEARIESIIQRIVDKPDVKYKNSSYTISAADDEVILADGTITITLPAAAGNTGCTFRIKNIGSGDVTVDTISGLIDGEAAQILNAQYYAIDVVSDGANWNIV